MIIIFFFPSRSGYQDEQIYAKVDDMTYYPVNNMLVSLPNTNSTSSSSQGGRGDLHHQQQQQQQQKQISSSSGQQGPALPSLPPGSKTLSLHHASAAAPGHHGTMGHHSTRATTASDYHAGFGTVHRSSQKIYL